MFSSVIIPGYSVEVCYKFECEYSEDQPADEPSTKNLRK